MKKVIKKIALFFVLALLIFCIVFGVRASQNPRWRLLFSMVHFTEKTLKDPSYLLYEVDIMELIRDYLNADTSVKGDMAIYEVKNLGFSLTMEVDGIRSLPQKKMASFSRAEVLGIEAGTSEFCAEDETVYMSVPSMNLAFAFPTGMEIFTRMPDLTSDINRQWFHDNAKNIIELTQQIGIEETGDYLRDTHGEKCKELLVTIPQGSAAFLWELLGMEMPEYDVKVSMYLNRKSHFRRMEIKLDHAMEGAALVIDGENAGTMLFYFDLPDGERMHMTITRLAERKNTISIESIYDTNTDVHYNMYGTLTWTIQEEGFKVKIKGMEVRHGSEVLAKINFTGDVLHLTEEPDVFQNVSMNFRRARRLDWKSIRDDMDGFVKDMMDELKEVRKNK